LVGCDGNIGGRVCDAGKNESISNLAVLKERLIRLVNGSSNNLSSAGGASSSTARVWKIKSFLLSLIEDIGVIRAFNYGFSFRGLKSDFVGSSSSHWCMDCANSNAGEWVLAGYTKALVSRGAENTSTDSRSTHSETSSKLLICKQKINYIKIPEYSSLRSEFDACMLSLKTNTVHTLTSRS